MQNANDYPLDRVNSEKQTAEKTTANALFVILEKAEQLKSLCRAAQTMTESSNENESDRKKLNHLDNILIIAENEINSLIREIDAACTLEIEQRNQAAGDE